MKTKKTSKCLRALAAFLVIPFSFSNISFAQASANLTDQQVFEQSIKTFQADNPETPTPSTQEMFRDSADFLINEKPLSEAAIEKQPAQPIQPEEQNYEYERYDFEEAVNQLRPDLASAVILKDLNAENLDQLVGLEFEIAIVVLHGEIVLFTSGSKDEIGVLPAVKELLSRASFSSHTHPSHFAAEGPSGQDLNEARENPGTKYVVTGKNIYAYDQNGVVTVDAEEYFQKLEQALSQEQDKDQVQARADLNQFIKEQDLFNSASTEERLTLLRGGNIAADPTVTSPSHFQGAAQVQAMVGSDPGSYFYYQYQQPDNSYVIVYNTVAPEPYAGLNFTFDDVSTPAVETFDLLAHGDIKLGVMSTSQGLKVQIEDDAGHIDTFTLTGLSLTNQYYKIPLSSISSSVDLTRVRRIQTFVDASVGADNIPSPAGRRAYVRFDGLGIEAPEMPVLTSPVPQYTKQLVLSGTKKPGDAIILQTPIPISGDYYDNDIIVPYDYSSTWSVTLNLPGGKNDRLFIRAKNVIGTLSSEIALGNIFIDNTPPVISQFALQGMYVNSEGRYVTSEPYPGIPYSVTPNVSFVPAGYQIFDDSFVVGQGLDAYQYSIDGGAWSGWIQNSSNSYSFPLTGPDGLKTVSFKVRDKALNESAIATDTIYLDQHNPVITGFSVNGGSPYANSRNVSLTIDASDGTGGTGLRWMRFSQDNGQTWSSWENYQQTKNDFALTGAGDGQKQISVEVMDNAGLISSWLSYYTRQTLVSDSIILDTTPPAVALVTSPIVANPQLSQIEFIVDGILTARPVPKILIEGDNAFQFIFQDLVGNQTVFPVTLTLRPLDLASTRTSEAFWGNHVRFGYAPAAFNLGNKYLRLTHDNLLDYDMNYWIFLDGQNVATNRLYAYGEESFFQIPTQFVNVQGFGIDIEAGAGCWRLYDCVFKKIQVFDSMPFGGNILVTRPLGYLPTTPLFSASPIQLSLTRNVVSPDDQMSFSTDGGVTWSDPVDFQNTYSLNIPGESGRKEIQFKLINAWGDEHISRDVVFLDHIPPAGSLRINKGDLQARGNTVTLDLEGWDSSSGLSQMQFSTDGGVVWSAWENFSLTKTNFLLPSGAGEKIVYARFKDKAGNVSLVLQDSITVNTFFPDGEAVINAGADYLTTPLPSDISLDLSTVRDAGGNLPARMQLKTDMDADWGPEVDFATAAQVPLQAGRGKRTVYARVIDALGNASIFQDSIFASVSDYLMEVDLSYFSYRPTNIAVDPISGYPFDRYNAMTTTQPTHLGFYALLLANVLSGQIVSDKISTDSARSALSHLMRSLLRDQREYVPNDPNSGLGFRGLIPWFTYDAPSRSWVRQTNSVEFRDNVNLTASLATAIGALSDSSVDPDDPVINAIKAQINTFIANQEDGYKNYYYRDYGSVEFFLRNNAGYDYVKTYNDEFRANILLISLMFDIPLAATSILQIETKKYTFADGHDIYTVAPWDGAAFQMLWPGLTMPEKNNVRLLKMLQDAVDIHLDFANRTDQPGRTAIMPGFVSTSYELCPGPTCYPEVGINDLQVDTILSSQLVSSLYTLGAAHDIRPEEINSFLEWIVLNHPQLISSHGLWEGYDFSPEGVITEQVFSNIATFVLGMAGTGAQNITRYLEANSIDLENAPDAPYAIASEDTDILRSSNSIGGYADDGQYPPTCGDTQDTVDPADGSLHVLYSKTEEGCTAGIEFYRGESFNASGQRIKLVYQSDSPFNLEGAQLIFRGTAPGLSQQTKFLAHELSIHQTLNEETREIVIDLPAFSGLQIINRVNLLFPGQPTGTTLDFKVVDFDLDYHGSLGLPRPYGAKSSSTPETFDVDRIPPTLDLTMNEKIKMGLGNALINSPAVTIRADAFDSGTGVESYRFSTEQDQDNNPIWGEWTDFTPNQEVLFAGGDGSKHFSYQVKDLAGNVAEEIMLALLDTIKPTGSISDGRLFAEGNLRTVSLVLSAEDNGSGIKAMRFSTDGLNWNDEKAFLKSENFELDENENPQAIYVQYGDYAGNWSEPFSVAVTAEIPEVTPPGIPIRTFADLQAMDLNGVYYLAADIDAGIAADFVPVGNLAQPFTGTFNGNGKIINGLRINLPQSDNVGLFGVLGAAAKIENVKLENVSIAGRNNVGALVGYSNGAVISHSSAEMGSVSGNDRVGGLIGNSFNGKGISETYTHVSVTGNQVVGGIVGNLTEDASHPINSLNTLSRSYALGTVNGSQIVGGLVGYLFLAKIEDSRAESGTDGEGSAGGTVTGTSRVGGLVGESYNGLGIKNSHTYVLVTGQSQVGGIVGKLWDGNANNMEDTYALGEVKGKNEVGGLVGYSKSGDMIRSYATGNVTGEDRVGGLVGATTENAGIHESYYGTGLVSGRTAQVGGIAGYYDSYDDGIKNTYFAGKVTTLPQAGVELAGGFLGTYNRARFLLSNYWDIQLNGGLQDAANRGDISDTQIQSHNTAAMKTQNTYVDWDFTNTWYLEGYPRLGRDYDPPSGLVRINGGADLSNSYDLFLTFEGSEKIKEFKYSVDGVEDESGWRSYTEPAPVTIPEDEGGRLFSVIVKDYAGNESETLYAFITIDRTAPEISFEMGYATGSFDQTLQLEASDASGLQDLCITEAVDGQGIPVFSPEYCQAAFVSEVEWTLSPGYGPKKVFVQVKDMAGNIAVTSDEVTVVDVNLDADPSLKAKDISRLTLPEAAVPAGLLDGRMIYADYPSDDGYVFLGALFPPLSPSLDLNQAAGDPWIFGLASPESIEGPVSLYMDSDIGSEWTPGKTGSVSFDLNLASSGENIFAISRERILEQNPDFNFEKITTILFLTYPDPNASGRMAFYFQPELTPPMASVVINEDYTYTISPSILLKLTAEDNESLDSGMEMRFSFDGTWTECENNLSNEECWQSFSKTKILILSSGDGEKKVYYQVRDMAGNISETAEDTIILDTTPPSIYSFSVNNGKFYTASRTVTLSASANESVSGLDKAYYSVDGGEWIETVVNSAAEIELTGADGVKTVAYRVRDKAGNQSETQQKVYLDTAAHSETDDILENLNNVSVVQPSMQHGFDENGDYFLRSSPELLNRSDISFRFDPVTIEGRYLRIRYRSMTGGPLYMVLSHDDGLSTSGVLSSGINVTANGQERMIEFLLPDSFSSNSNTKPSVINHIDFFHYPTNPNPMVPFDLTITSMIVGGPSVKPVVTAVIENDALYATSQNVKVSMTVSAGTPTDMCYSLTGPDCSQFVPYQAELVIPLTGADGNRTIYFKVRNEFGTESDVFSDEITLDTAPPSGTLTINQGAAYTNSSEVILNFTGTDATSGVSKIQFLKEDGTWDEKDFSATTMDWTVFPSGDGVKTVIMRLVDGAGLVSEEISDSIILDTVLPQAQLVINGGNLYAVSPQVTLALSAQDSDSGLDKVRYSADGGVTWTDWEDYASSRQITLSASNGTKTVLYQARDKAGNESQIASRSIVLDTVAPTGSLVINGGAANTNSAQVNLTITANDQTSGVSKMQFSLDGGLTWSQWENFAVAKTITLQSPDGLKTVRARLMDTAGLMSQVFSNQILLDTTPPDGWVAISVGGRPYTRKATVSLSISASDLGSGVQDYRFSVDGGNTWTSWKSFNAPGANSVTLPGPEGLKTVLYQLRDKAGNTAIKSDTIYLGVASYLRSLPVDASSVSDLNKTLEYLNKDLQSAQGSLTPVKYSLLRFQATNLAADINKLSVKFKADKYSKAVNDLIALYAQIPISIF